MVASTALVPVGKELVRTDKPNKKATIDEQDAIPRPEVEVVTAEELRHEEQVTPKAKPPETFFESAPRSAPKFPGADVSSEALLGFLAAAELVVPNNKNYPILSSVKVTYQPGGHPRLYIESNSNEIWTLVALNATATSDQGFAAMMPLRHARSAVNAIRLNYKSVLVGLNEDKLCLGPTMVPYGGKVADFPAQPVLRDWEARAAVPAFYFEEICSRVIPAQGTLGTLKDERMRGVLLDFDVVEVEGHQRILCSAIATDGGRIHIFRMPRVQVQTRAQDALPPPIMVPAKYFSYLRSVANREWTAFEINEEQLIGRGEDYLAVVKATMPGKALGNVMDWRKVDVRYPGNWTVDRKDLERIAKAAVDASKEGDIRLRIDSIHESLELCSWGEEGQKFKDRIPARRFDGPPVVQVKLNGRYLLQAVLACKSGLIHLGFQGELEDQAYSPIVVEGEEENFKAVMMPLT